MIAAPVITPGRYRHYKGNDYQVIATAKHSETDEWVVVYRCLYGDHSWWVRPSTLFTDTVVVGGDSVPRFRFMDALAHD